MDESKKKIDIVSLLKKLKKGKVRYSSDEYYEQSRKERLKKAGIKI